MRRFVLCLTLLAPSVQPAMAQTAGSDADSIRRSLGDALSFATFGAISGLGPDTQVTREGDAYHVHMPLTGLTAPSDPAVSALATPAANGAWDVQSLTFPSTATIDARGPGTGTVTYTIGKQDITAHIAPDLAQPTTYVARFGDIRLDSDAGKQRARQTIGSYVVKGTMKADGDGRVAMTSTGEVTDWNMGMIPESGPAVAFMTRRMSIDATVEGLDRARGERLRARMRDLLAVLPKPAQPGQASPEARAAAASAIDDLVGLLTRFQIDETLEDVKISGQAGQGSVGSMVIGVRGESVGQTLNARLDLALNDLTAPVSLPPLYAAYVPKHISLRNRITGLPAEQVQALLRAAVAPDANPAALEAQAVALLSTRGATVSLDPFSFDAGPLAVTGTARLVPDPVGGIGGHIHIIASGMDALISQAQGNPALGHIMPMLYMAKGMSRPDGASIVWDIDLDHGGVRINGTPFGGHQPPPPPGHQPLPNRR